MAEPEQQQPSPQPQTSASFNYNVRWMTSTFDSRAKVESLLGPEHAAGNVSSHDYEAAIKFLPGFHRYYGLLLSSAALSAIYVLRRPSWSQRRILAITTGGAFGSMALGNALTLKSHFGFVRSLNNPEGFAKALDHIKEQNGQPLPASPVITRNYDTEERLHGNTDEPQVTFPPEPSAERQPQSSQPHTSDEPTRPPSKWDQIRTNAATSTSSSWDALRQKHEKSRLQQPAAVPVNQNTQEQDNDRAAEQAQFDALLERERKLGTQNIREY